MRTMSPRGQRFLEQFEGLVLRPYNDVADNATIGIGHLIHYGPVTDADRERYRHFTAHDAYQLLAADLRPFAHDIHAYIRPALNQHQFDAVLDLIYNCGPAPLAGNLGRLLNERQWGAAADAFLPWCHAAGRVIPGLQRRRQAERQLYLHGTY